jgi:hypothetical protein
MADNHMTHKKSPNRSGFFVGVAADYFSLISL